MIKCFVCRHNINRRDWEESLTVACGKAFHMSCLIERFANTDYKLKDILTGKYL